MATTDIKVQLPVLDATQSVEIASFTETTITTDMQILNAMKNKNNSFVLIVNATKAGTVTLKAGDNHPNTMLGDLTLAVAIGVNVIRLQDISRFEKRDGSVKLTTATVEGTIFATAKRAGISPVNEQ